MNKLVNKIEKYFFLIPVAFVVIVAFPHLSLPYFWDEAWSYFPAVFKMYENGPGLLPGALPLWDAKGHPLFFFFLASSWMRLVGTSVFWVHILPFLISLGTLYALFNLVKKFAGIWAANIASLLFSVQSLFLAQTTLLLPEMLITMLLLLSINFYLNRKYVLFVLMASMMVLTKETSIVFIGGFLIFHLVSYLKPGRESKKYIIESFQIIIPLIVYGIFLILHKKEFGTFFFQSHTNYIQLNFATILKKLQIAISIIFIEYGRNVILYAVLGTIVFLIFKKKKLKNKKLLALLILQTVIFLLFSALNFYTLRYMLSLLALFIIFAAVLLVQIKINKWTINVLAILLITVIPMYYTFTRKTNADSDLGYVQAVKIHQQMVKYCEDQGWENEPVSASFNLIFCLRNPDLGYVSDKEGFTKVMDLQKFRKAKIFVNECTSFGAEAQLDSIRNENNLAKEFYLGNAWGKIYTNYPVK